MNASPTSPQSLETTIERRTYENNIIGNFLVGFGLVMGSRHSNSGRPFQDLYVNLTQQNPLDGRLSDVIMECSGLVRILEFKRASSKATKESAKHLLLNRAFQAPELAHLRETALKLHWYIETQDNDPHRNVVVVPYLDLDSKEPRPTMDLSTFIERTVHCAMTENIDASQDEINRQYMRTLWRLQSKRTSKKPEALYGALVIQLAGTGSSSSLRFAAVQDIRHFFMTIGEIRQEEHGLERGLERSGPAIGLSRDITQDLSLTRNGPRIERDLNIERDLDLGREIGGWSR